MTEQPGEPLGQHIGHGVFIRLTSMYGQPDHIKVGLIENHPTPDGKRCEGYVTFDVPETAAKKVAGRPMWKVLSWEPLTLAPSLLCRECGHHGFIRNGQWEPAA